MHPTAATTLLIHSNLAGRRVMPSVRLLLMTTILHISDPHFETWETMPRLNNLAHSHSECDVLALTGDCTSDRNKQLPKKWNEWPQRLKLSVPGNHDLPDTFDRLSSWEHCTPWVRRLDELIFVGVDTSAGFLGMSYQLEQLKSDAVGGDAVIFLSHRWPAHVNDKWVGEVIKQFVGDRILLILHGHDQPPGVPRHLLGQGSKNRRS